MRVLAVLCVTALSIATPGQSDDTEPNAKPANDLTSLTLEQLANVTVEGASLHPQSLEDAPASVTIITAEDIHKYGYRTLAEALASVRGFCTSYNRSYHTVGVRGFNLPGDYASRFLVMINGHNMADNILNFVVWFGGDFPLDMSLVKRIEIIRGPSSALYGSNGMFATINIITKSPGEAGPSRLATEIGSFGEKKVQVMTTVPIGRNMKVLFAGSVFNNSGESPLFFPEFDAPATNYGQALRMDNEKGYHFFSNLVWRNWSITAVFADREKIQPISWGDTIFNNRGTKINDIRNYVEAAYTREIHGNTFRWRTYYDAYRFSARFDYPLDPGSLSPGLEDNRQFFLGDWVGTQATYRFELPHFGTLTTGAEAKFDLQAIQRSRDVSPSPDTFLDINPRDKSFALFVQEERQLSSRWKADLGVRFDFSAVRHSFLSPRAGLIYQPSPAWSYKFLYGRGFRNPSMFELFFDDGGRSGAPNPNARPEKADTMELDVERKLGKRMHLLAGAYGYRLRDFLEGQYVAGGVIQYQNVGKIHTIGFETEINGQPTGWLEATASYAIQRATENTLDGILSNSPEHLAKLRFAVPIGHKFEASGGMQYCSSRETLTGNFVGSVYLADFTITSRRLLPNFDFQFGVRNAFNRNYFDPIALTQQVDTMGQPGRSFFVDLIARAHE
jgi:outer membrane receptor for ferrienterochelin and colicins